MLPYTCGDLRKCLFSFLASDVWSPGMNKETLTMFPSLRGHSSGAVLLNNIKDVTEFMEKVSDCPNLIKKAHWTFLTRRTKIRIIRQGGVLLKFGCCNIFPQKEPTQALVGDKNTRK